VLDPQGAGGSEFVQGNGYLAAGYVHRSSRAGDPQLHTHVLVANATKGPDGRWTRLYHPAIYDHAKTASYIYEAHLRHELSRRLDVEWQPTRKGIAEIAGFADEHLRAFSTRRAEILEAAGTDASARSMQVAALATRKPKERDVGHGELLARWRPMADEIGLDREAIARTFDSEAALRIGSAETFAVSEVQLGRAVTASASHFDRREAIQAVADSLPEGAPGAGRRRSGSRAAARAGDHRRADLPARLRQERAGGEAERSGEAEGMGSGRCGDRALPPGARDQRPEQSAWPRGETRGRASATRGGAAADS
jgi:hypothetical protein